jgi:general secretion pathway protein F
MSGFEYLALDATGREVKGVVEGDTDRQARQILRERGMTPLEVAPIDEQPERSARRLAWRRGLSRGDLTLLTRQFATLARAGLPIEECLNVLIEQTESASARNVLASVRARVLEGQSLARSLAAVPRAFPEIYRAMVDAGEQSGKLAEVLERLADYTEEREVLRQRIALAFVYPAIVTVVALAVVGLLLVYVVPQVTRVFVNLGQALPWPTRLLIWMSEVAQAGGLLWPAALAALAIGVPLALRNPALRHLWHRRLLGLPLVGRLVRGVNAARFADTLGILTASGVPLLAALQSAVTVMNNLPMRAAVEDAVRRVREGGALAHALGRTRIFPPLVVHLVASGEASGKLDVMLARAAEAQAREMENWVRWMTALLEPVLILAMGLIVLFVVIAILLPIFEMNQLVK